MNTDITDLMKKGVDNFNQNNVSDCMEIIANTIKLRRDKFEPAWWHNVADIFINFLNAIKSLAKSLGADIPRTQLFSERDCRG